MLKWSAFFLVTALIAAVMAFANEPAVVDPLLAKMLFFILIILFLLSLFFKRNTSH